MSRCSFRADTSKNLVGLREGWRSVRYLFALLWRQQPQTPAPLAHFSRLANLSNCFLCLGSQRGRQGILVLHKQPESWSPIVLHLSLVSIPADLQSPWQWGPIFPEQIPRTKCARYLSIYLLPTLFLSLLLVGCDGGLDLKRLLLCPFIFPNVVCSFLPGVSSPFCSFHVGFRVSCI